MLFIYDGLFSNDRLWAFIDSGTDWNPFQAYQWLTSVHGTVLNLPDTLFFCF